jgi:hypothetical protein
MTTIVIGVTNQTTALAACNRAFELARPGDQIHLVYAVEDMRAAMAAIASEFATGVRSGIPHPLDVQRGLRLQRLVHTVETLLTTLPRLHVDEDHVIKALAPSSI